MGKWHRLTAFLIGDPYNSLLAVTGEGYGQKDGNNGQEADGVSKHVYRVINTFVTDFPAAQEAVTKYMPGCTPVTSME